MWQLDAERARLQDDLRGLVAGEVRCDPLFCGLYASDGSILAVEPLAVVRPVRLRDIKACVDYAAERKIPVIPRGAGSGCAGGAIGPGIVLDLSRFFRQIRSSQDGTVHVAAGVTVERLNQALRSSGRYFPWYTSSGGVSTLGGLISRAACSPFHLHYGDIGRYIVALQVVLADGSVVEVPNQPTAVFEAVYVGKPHPEWWTRLGRVLQEHWPTILAEQASPLRRAGGYRLAYVLGDSALQDESCKPGTNSPPSPSDVPGSTAAALATDWSGAGGAVARQPQAARLEASPATAERERTAGGLLLNPAQLFIGAEGTLGIITEVEICPPMLPPAQGLVVFFFESLEEALRALPAAVMLEPLAAVVVDHRHLCLSREVEPRLAATIPREAQAGLLVDIAAADNRRLRQAMDSLRLAVQSKAKTLGPGVWAFEPWDRQLFGQLHQPVPWALYRVRGAARPVPFVDDVAIPTERLADFLAEAYRALRQAEVTAIVYTSGGDGRVAIRPIVDLKDPRQREALLAAAEALYNIVLEFGGSIAAGCGWGLVRTPYLPRQFSRLISVFEEVKRIFDPAGIMNPGKIVGGWSLDELCNLIRNGELLREIRVCPSPGPVVGKTAVGGKTARGQIPARKIGFSSLADALEPLRQSAGVCFACGGCRHQFAVGRMCPVFRFLPAEEAAPRAKANLLLGLLAVGAPVHAVASPTVREIAELCVQCHMCTIECPAAVDIPRVALELKGQHAATAGLMFSDWVLARLDLLAGLASKVPRFANWVLRTRWTRWLMERTLGIALGRRLPPVASSTFLSRAARAGWTRPGKQRGLRVAYFVDVYANFFAPELGELFAKILEHNNVGLFVPEKQRQAAVPAITSGALDIARRFVRRNSRVLANAVRLGYRVLGTEPAAVLALKREYPQIDPSADVRLVAENIAEACSFLWDLHQDGKLQLDFRPIPLTVGYHQPCRSKALGVGRPGENLLRLIPGLQVIPLPDMCSGMAGTFGLKSANYRASLRGGFPLIAALREPVFHAGVTECSACKLQLEQGAGKVVLHPIELLACAYGFVELDTLFRRHGARARKDGG